MATAGATGEQTRLVRGLRWVSLGRSERAAWGRCQGSAATPYETVVAADRPSTTSCSCPSRNRPCKHAVGLADLAADGQIAVTDEPDWVAGIVGRRPFTQVTPGDATSTGPREGLVDPEAAVRRAEARRDKVAAGLAELQLWLGDQVRTGLAGLPRAGYGHFDAIAARMVDAQAPGVAATLRALPADLVTADWPGRALHALGGLHLLARAHQQLDDLPEELAATVRSRVGYPVSKETVRSRPAVSDRWWAIAGIDTVEYQLTTRRVWLRGLDTGRWAMWLTVAPPGRDLDLTIRPGRTYACAAQFYPGSGQYRALIEPPVAGSGPATDLRPDPGRGGADPIVGRRRPGRDRHPARRAAGRGPVGDPAAGRARRGAGAAAARRADHGSCGTPVGAPCRWSRTREIRGRWSPSPAVSRCR